MEITRSELITALRRVGVLGTVESGMFDNILSPNAGSDHTAEIQELQAKDVTQDSRITANEAALLTKAGLINGKVPYEQLPEFPVGRKVNVANQAARFALPVYADLTIAYQSDTGDAWGLDANADPAISNNWSKLGNAQGIGVASFNGRTGNIGPMSGDYNTGQITEIVDKRFVTGTQITTWDAKETTTGSQSKATAAQTAAKTYADSTFLPLGQKNAASGVAPLDSSSRVPVANLPSFLPRRQRAWYDLLATNVKDVWYTTPSDVETDIYIATSAENSGAYVLIEARQNSASTIFSFFGTTVSSTTNGPTVSTVCNVTVPQGWQYRLKGSSLGTRTLTRWYELR